MLKRTMFYLLWLIVVPLLLAEILLTVGSRLFYPRLTVTDPLLGWKYQPAARAERDYSLMAKLLNTGEAPGGVVYDVRINSDGFRDDEFKPDSSVTKIMVLGDSMTFGMEVSQHQTFCSLLEQRLKADVPEAKPVVANFGITGYGTAQQLLVLEHYFPTLTPEVVALVMFEGNDFEDNLGVFENRFRPHFDLIDGELVLHNKPSFLQRLGNRLRDYSVLYFLVSNKLNLFNETHPASEEQIRELAQKLIGRMHGYLTARRTPFLIVYIRRHEDEGRFLAMKDYADKAGIPITQIPLDQRNRFGGMGHLNPEGHRHVAAVLYEMLRTNRLIGGKNAQP